MIQRVQTLYLIGVVLAGILFLMLPIASISVIEEISADEFTTTVVTTSEEAQATELDPTEATEVAETETTDVPETETTEVALTESITAEIWVPFKCGDSFLTLLLESLTCIIAIITIFSYRKHKLQLRLTGFNIVLEIGMPILVWVVLKDYTLHIRFGMGLPFIQIILTWLAMRGIFKDFLTLKSLDRLR